MSKDFCPEYCGGCSCRTGNPPCSHCTDHGCPDCGFHECVCDLERKEKDRIKAEFREKINK